MTRKQSRILSFLTHKRFLYMVSGFVGLFLLMNYVILPAYVNHGDTLTVPDVTGLPVETASTRLESIGMEPVVADTKPDPKAPTGTVTMQNPQGEAVVKHGRRVYLTVSGGEVLVGVPSLRGRSTRDSRFALERSGLVLGDVDYATSDTYPENTIMQQSISAGAKVSKGTAVSVVVSRGRVEQDIVVPELIGKTISEAEKQLLVKGLKVGNITYQSSFDLLPNTVVDQFPRGGEFVPAGQAVDLFVVKVGRPQEEITNPRN